MKVFVFSILMSLSFVTNSGPDILNSWLCRTEYDSYPIKNVIENRIEIKDSSKVILNTHVNFIDKTSDKRTVIHSIIIGSYLYQDELLTYTDIKEKKVNVVKDDLGMIDKEALIQLGELLEQKSTVSYKTIKLTNDAWESENSETGEKLNCHAIK